MKELKIADSNWMVWRVLRQDSVKPVFGQLSQEDQKDEDWKKELRESGKHVDYLQRGLTNLLTALFKGYEGTYRIFPNNHHLRHNPDWRMNREFFNAPPWVQVEWAWMPYPRHAKVESK